MSILVNKDSRVIVQGITGQEGSFHGEQCALYGTQLVGGVTPGKGGQKALSMQVPVFDTVYAARQATACNVSLIFVPAAFAGDAILESMDAGMELIVCITEGIPTKDMLGVYDRIQKSNSRLIGPNCPGLLSPDEAKVGIMPGFIAKKGNVGIISKSGTLTYEAVDQLTQLGIGQSTCIGIGGDPIIGSKMDDLLSLFHADPETEALVLIGEIGGAMEIEAALCYAELTTKKPVVAFIAGETAPAGRRMGHAGAIISGADESAAAKKKFMRSKGIHVVDSPADIGKTMQALLA